LTKILIAGASPDTGNMGVSALFYSTLYGLLRNLPDAEFYAFDNGLGCRKSEFNIGSFENIPVGLIGVRGGLRVYRSGNLHTLSLASKTGRYGRFLNATLKQIASCDAILDVSGGDSFSDIYGSKRFYNIITPKMISIKLGIPLILLPQTYGPYIDSHNFDLASKATKGANLAWSRDPNSFVILKQLLAHEFDEKRHFDGLDLAFSLPKKEASEKLSPEFLNFLYEPTHETPIVGINISGLVYNDPTNTIKNFKFKANYEEVLMLFVHWLLNETNARITLISHVMNPSGHYESDYGAAESFAKKFPENHADRIKISPNNIDAGEVKWIISKMDWFSGMRMHSTIAGLSSLVPTSAIAYSDKTKGVFQTCRQSHQVFDPRVLNTDALFEKLKTSFLARKETQIELDNEIPKVLEKAENQFTIISKKIRDLSRNTRN